MSFIGDLERLFATSLYPLRVPIAAGLIIAAVALVVLARRRGWFDAARRHPYRAGTLTALLLAVGAPTLWYLGSPLFIRTSLVEPPPSIAPTTPPVPSPAATAATSATAPPAATAAAADPSRSGEFKGADDFHFGSGTARLVETAPGRYTVRFEQFSVRNGPDLYVYLSPSAGGYVDGAIELGLLKATDGDFNTDVPAGTDVSGVKSVVIWCRQFAVQFAHAELK